MDAKKQYRAWQAILLQSTSWPQTQIKTRQVHHPFHRRLRITQAIYKMASRRIRFNLIAEVLLAYFGRRARQTPKGPPDDHQPQ